MGFGHRVYKNGDPRNAIIKVSFLKLYFIFIFIGIFKEAIPVFKHPKCKSLIVCNFGAHWAGYA